MKYIRLQIVDDEDNLVYEKDVDERNAFHQFLRGIERELLREGTLQKNDRYSAAFVPQYGDYLNPNPLLLAIDKDAERSSTPIELRLENPVQPDRFVRYFTVEIIVWERRLGYRRDYLASDVAKGFVSMGIEQALLTLGALKTGDTYAIRCFVRDDEEFDFDKERIPHLEKSAELLIELTDDEQVPSFPSRDPQSYGDVEMLGKVDDDDIQIYVSSAALDRLLEEARVPVEVERGGILVGEVFTILDGNRLLVEISDLIVSEHTTSTVVELRYTFESWQGHNAQLREQFPGKRIVGWYHTHLIDISIVTGANKVEHTKMFFSQDDKFLHSQFFPDDWYVAMVLDPEGNSIFFQWKNREICRCGGFYRFGCADSASEDSA